MEFRDLKKQYRVLQGKIGRAISDALENGVFIGGEPVRILEKRLAEYAGVHHCISCANGTDALTLSLKAWGIGEGDAVFVPDFTFFSTAECPAAEGAQVIFVDVLPDTFNLDPVRLREEVDRIRESGRYVPKAVIAVDLFGQPAEYVEIRKICDEYGMLLLEDGAQGFGGRIGEKKACSFGDISTTSFFPAKPLGCYGDGGAVFTDNDEWAEKIRSLAVHGKGTDKYDNIRIGMNSRLDTLQAIILNIKLDAFQKTELEKVNQVAVWYEELLKYDFLKTPVVKDGYYSSWAQYTVKISENLERELVQKVMSKHGIPVNVYYVNPLHTQKAFMCEADCPVTESLCRTVLSLPIHPYMEKNDVMTVKDAWDEVCREKRIL